MWVPLLLLFPLSVQAEHRGELSANPSAADSRPIRKGMVVILPGAA
jgi:hypothetical protein